MCATSSIKRIFHPKIILVIRGQGIPQNSCHEMDTMQEIMEGRHTQNGCLCVGIETATGRAVMVGFAGGMEQARRERQHGGKVSHWPLVTVELLAPSY